MKFLENHSGGALFCGIVGLKKSESPTNVFPGSSKKCFRTQLILRTTLERCLHAQKIVLIFSALRLRHSWPTRYRI